MCVYNYRHPWVATELIMFCFCLFLFYFFLFTVRSQKILNWFSPNLQELCSLNNPVVLKIILTPSCGRKTQKTANICSELQELTQIFDNNVQTVEDNSNLKQIWTRRIVSLHFWRISFWTVGGQLRSICSIGWEHLYFCQIATFSLLTEKLLNRFAQNIQVNCALWSSLDNHGVQKIILTPSCGYKCKKDQNLLKISRVWLRFLTITSKRSYGFSQFLHYLCLRIQGIYCWHPYWATMFEWPPKSKSISGSRGTDDSVL